MADTTTTGLNTDEIQALVKTAPMTGYWVHCRGSVWIPHFTATDDQPISAHDTGRYLTLEANTWHNEDDLPDEVLAFIASAPHTIRQLLAEVKRLRAALDGAA